MKKDIIQVWDLAHPVEEVWQCLTDPVLLSQWLMENDFKAEVGHKFRFITRPKIKMGFDGIVYCEVIKVEPLRQLVYSWKGGPGNGSITLDTVVTWKLEKYATGTRVILEHAGFKGWSNYLTYFFMNQGWKGKVKNRLTRLLEGDGKNKI